jgi:hypothetical protein
MRWFSVVALVVLSGGLYADDVPAPLPDPLSIGQSIECEWLEDQLNEVNYEIDAVRAAITRTQNRIADVSALLALCVGIQQQYIANNQPTPPGVIDAINIYRLWLNQLDATLRGLQAKLAELAARNNAIWAQWELAGCG